MHFALRNTFNQGEKPEMQKAHSFSHWCCCKRCRRLWLQEKKTELRCKCKATSGTPPGCCVGTAVPSQIVQSGRAPVTTALRRPRLTSCLPAWLSALQFTKRTSQSPAAAAPDRLSRTQRSAAVQHSRQRRHARFHTFVTDNQLDYCAAVNVFFTVCATLLHQGCFLSCRFIQLKSTTMLKGSFSALTH